MDTELSGLNDQWRALVLTEQEWAARMAREHSTLAGCTGLDDVLCAVRGDPDAVLGLLIRAQAAGDELAGRVVLQALLGKMSLMARRDPCHQVGDYVAELWLRIRTFPLERRPRRIAANLCLDVLKAITSSHGDRCRTADPHRLAALLDSPDPWREALPVTASTVIDSAVDLQLIDAATSDVLRVVYVEGATSADAGRRFGVSPEVIRWRCSRAVRAMARHARELAEAA